MQNLKRNMSGNKKGFLRDLVIKRAFWGTWQKIAKGVTIWWPLTVLTLFKHKTTSQISNYCWFAKILFMLFTSHIRGCKLGRLAFLQLWWNSNRWKSNELCFQEKSHLFPLMAETSAGFRSISRFISIPLIFAHSSRFPVCSVLLMNFLNLASISP